MLTCIDPINCKLTCVDPINCKLTCVDPITGVNRGLLLILVYGQSWMGLDVGFPKTFWRSVIVGLVNLYGDHLNYPTLVMWSRKMKSNGQWTLSEWNMTYRVADCALIFPFFFSASQVVSDRNQQSVRARRANWLDWSDRQAALWLWIVANTTRRQNTPAGRGS